MQNKQSKDTNLTRFRIKCGIIKKGFTLAEVLITLGIIGVVAAMTIPTLMNNIADAQLKTSFKKAYSIASQAWQQAVTDNQGVFTGKGGWGDCPWADGTPVGDSYTNPVDGRAEAFKSKMKVAKSCINEKGCWPDDYEFVQYVEGTNKTGAMSPYSYSWLTADGMCWAVPWKDGDESLFIVDTNCNKNPNKLGQDIFAFLLGVDGVIYSYFGDKSATSKAVTSGLVCPFVTDPQTINGRSVSFNKWLYN